VLGACSHRVGYCGAVAVADRIRGDRRRPCEYATARFQRHHLSADLHFVLAVERFSRERGLGLAPSECVPGAYRSRSRDRSSAMGNRA
jgi:hypothetical protein